MKEGSHDGAGRNGRGIYSGAPLGSLTYVRTISGIGGKAQAEVEPSGGCTSFRPDQKLILTSSQSKALWWTRAISIRGKDEIYARHKCWEKHHGRQKG